MKKFNDVVIQKKDALVKQPVDETIINSIQTQADFEAWCKSYKPKYLSDIPDTLKAFGVSFENTGILPYGWNVNPYDTITYSGDQVGVAHMFADNYQNKARFCYTDGYWYVFNEMTGWQKDVGRTEVLILVDEFQAALKYAKDLIDDAKFKERFYDEYCSQLSSNNQIKNFLGVAAPLHTFSASDIDTAIDVLAVQNGVIKLNRDGTFDFHAFTPEDMTTRHMATVYDPNAKCPTWDRFISEVLGGDQDIIRFFKIFMGQTLYGHNDQKAFGILYGPSTNNGKSTLTMALKVFYGDYAVSVGKALISKKRQDSVGDCEQVAKTKGARLVTLPEPDQDLIVDVAAVKNLTGNAPVNARFLHQNSFDFIPGFTLIIDTNYKIWMRDRSIFDRGSVILFPFNEVFTGSKADSTLNEKLMREFPGILNWMLEGWSEYCAATQNGSKRWVLPQSMINAIKQYCYESDTMGCFLAENYVVTGNHSDRIRPDVIYQDYRNWSDRNGDQCRSKKVVLPDVTKRLSDLLRNHLGITGRYNEDFSKYKDSSGNRYYWGIVHK